MTTKRKIEILKAMLPLIKTTGRHMDGLCYTYSEVTGKDCYTWECVEILGKLGLTPPDNEDAIFWYERTKKGDEQRRAAIRKAIKRLQKKVTK